MTRTDSGSLSASRATASEAGWKYRSAPNQAFATTHALTLKRLAGKYPELDEKGEMAKWIPKVNKEGLSVSQLTRAVNAAYKPDAAPGFTSLFQERGTDEDAGVYRFSPVRVVISKLSDEEKAELKGELEMLLEKLG